METKAECRSNTWPSPQEASNLKSRQGTTQLHHFSFSLHWSSTSQKGFSSYSFHCNTKTFDGFPLFSQSNQTPQPETRRNRTKSSMNQVCGRSISNSTLTWPREKIFQNKTTNTTRTVFHGSLAYNAQIRKAGFATRLPECKFIINYYLYFLLSL